MTRLQQRVFATIAYADIFHFPLTRTEILYWLVGGGTRLPSSVPGTESPKNFGDVIVLRGRNTLPSKRKRRKQIASYKWVRAHRIARMFRCIPTVRLVGVTGALAVDNVTKRDDIDLFFVVGKGTLWITRALVTLLADVSGVRRKPNDRRVSDKICLNMFMAEDALTVPLAERDLFSAHEVLQMRPLWERDGAYVQFLRANAWVGRFLPNAWRKTYRFQHASAHKAPMMARMLRRMFVLGEPLAKMSQLWYMNRRRTSEVIRRGVLRFHPKDARTWIRQGLADRLHKFNIPLDNIFYQP